MIQLIPAPASAFRVRKCLCCSAVRPDEEHSRHGPNSFETATGGIEFSAGLLLSSSSGYSKNRKATTRGEQRGGPLRVAGHVLASPLLRVEISLQFTFEICMSFS